MDQNLLKKLGLASLLLGFALASQACVVHSQPHSVAVSAPAPQVAVATNYYTPQYYNGYVVYYNDVGRPYYYYNGSPMYIPETYPNYHVYVTHYHRYRPHYNRWYHSRGHRYHTYRAPGYRGVAVRPAPRPVVRHRAPAPRPVVRHRGPAPRPVVRHRGPAPRPVVHHGAPPPRRAQPRRNAPRRRAAPVRRGGPPVRRSGAPAPPPSPPR